MKTAWIIDHYSSEPKYGGISRQYDFAKELAERGYNVVVIASLFSHFTHSYISEGDFLISEVSSNVHYVYLRTTSYTKNGGLERLKNMISFQNMVIKNMGKIAKKFGKPEVVNGCSVHPFAWSASYVVSKKFRAKLCVEVRDLWPEVWVLSGEKSKYSPMVILIGLLEKWAYKKADRIIYSMNKGNLYICDKLGFEIEKTYLIGQPMDCERFDLNASRNYNLIPDEIRAFIKDSFVCTFAGYYMSYEGVYTMLEAAKYLQKRNVPIKMVFVGSGQEKEGMLKYIKENDLENVFVGDRISKEAIPTLLRHTDIAMAHLAIPEHKEAYKYGVSKNKVNEYLYSGAVTLYGFYDKEEVVETSGGGYIFEPFNAFDLSNKINDVYLMSEKKREDIGKNGKSYIVNNHSSKVLTDRLESVLFDW